MTMREKLIALVREKLEASLYVRDAGLCAAIVDAILAAMRDENEAVQREVLAKTMFSTQRPPA